MELLPIIASSFVVKSSSRKDDILAAFKNPINTELVEQLVSYLDDKYTQPVDRHPEPVEPEVQPDAEQSDDSGNMEPIRPTPPRGGGEPSLASLFGDDVDDSFEGPAEEPSGGEESTLDEPEALVEPEPEIPSAVAVSTLDSIHATLNECPNTAGIRASRQLGDEMWLYYQDTINLNKIMESVIEAVPDNWEFNRLARSNNAIVFTTR